MNCPVCGAPGSVFFEHPEGTVYECRACTHRFTDPASTREQVAYEDDYRHDAHRNWFENPNLRLFEWIEARLPASTRSVLDVGCGDGAFLRYLRAKRPAVELLGVDLGPPGHGDRITFEQRDVLENPPNRRFDAVVSLAAIEHVPDVRGFMARLTELCEPGGTIAVMTLDATGLLYRASDLGRRLGVSIAANRLYSAHHLHHFTSKSFEETMRGAGLTLQHRLQHNIPLGAVDLPKTSAPVRAALFAGVAALFAVDRLVGHGYLQTLIGRAPAA